MTQHTVLVVEDESSSRAIYYAILKQAGFRVVEAEGYAQAIEHLQHTAVNVALLDLRLGGKSGIDLLKYIHKHYPACPVIMMSAFADKKNAIEVLREGAADYLEKPVNPHELAHVMQHWASYSSLKREHVSDLYHSHVSIA